MREGRLSATYTRTRLTGGLLVIGVLGGIAAFSSSNARLTREGKALSAPFAAGPQTAIACPAGSISVSTGTNIQTFVDVYPGKSTFCLKAGVHPIASAITPKTGNIFVGEFGAILDGTGWMTTDPDQGAFGAHNQDIDDVTIRNLVIRNMPQKGIHAFKDFSDRWTIENNEISGNVIGVAAPNDSVVRNNYIHHNTGGGYAGYGIVGTTFENNEIAYNGRHKIVGSTNVTFRNNFVHHNLVDGIWYDTENTNGLIEGNRVEDNGREGIFYEVSARGVIRNNMIRRSATSGIFVSTSKGMEIYNNTLEDNLRGIQYFVDCGAVGGGRIRFDLANNSAHDNTVIVGTRRGAYANGFAHISSCTATQIAPYLNGSRNLTFRNTSYVIPAGTGKYWFWGLRGAPSWSSGLWGLSSLKSWREWQAMGQDTAGVLSQ
jgi:parallel beta-helix repeat protein